MTGDGLAGRLDMPMSEGADVSRVSRSQGVGVAYRCAALVLRPLMTALTRHQWIGADQLSVDSGIVVATNHLSWLDPIVISHVLWDNDRPPRFLAKDALFRTPGIGWVMRSAKQIPVTRGTRDAADSVEAAVDAVQRGECVVVYPEGTITKDPDLWPMAAKSGAARIAMTAGVPVIPMAHWGAQEVMRPYRKELRLLPRKMMRVRIGPPVHLADLYGEQDRLSGTPLDAEILRVATERIMDAITALLREIRKDAS